jgi:hypothetical protein
MMRITRTIIPIPPIQCVKLLQNKIEFGNTSISVRIEAPVVENPETDSKYASMKDGIDPEKIYGRQPIRLIRNQDAVTVRYVSFLWISGSPLLSFDKKNSTIPEKKDIPAVITKGMISSE